VIEDSNSGASLQNFRTPKITAYRERKKKKKKKKKKNFRQRNEYQNDIRFLKEQFKHCVGRYSAAWPASL